MSGADIAIACAMEISGKCPAVDRGGGRGFVRSRPDWIGRHQPGRGTRSHRAFASRTGGGFITLSPKGNPACVDHHRRLSKQCRLDPRARHRRLAITGPGPSGNGVAVRRRAGCASEPWRGPESNAGCPYLAGKPRARMRQGTAQRRCHIDRGPHQAGGGSTGCSGASEYPWVRDG